MLLVFSCAAKKKKAEPPPPIVGWHQAAGATGACWHPPDFAAMGIVDRRAARDQTYQAMRSQWAGERSDGVSFEATTIEGVENKLLALPEKIEQVAVDNLALCEKAMAAGGDTGAWGSWLVGLPAKLAEGECFGGLTDTLGWYLEVNQGWQGGAELCPDDVVKITASPQDYYRLAKGGAWINAAGDTAEPAHGEGVPCTTEGCFPGQLVLRFRGKSGVSFVKPVGLELVFRPPEAGTIEFMVNDAQVTDNEFKIEAGLVHHTSVTYEPIKD
jgi:hypothetical protein